MNLRETVKRLVIISVCFILLFNYPVISLFNTTRPFLGIPAMLLYLAIAWAAFIVVLVVFMQNRSKFKRRK